MAHVTLQEAETPTAAAAAAADDKEFSVSHPLQNEWTLWFDSPASQAKQGTWMDNLYKICTFGTVRCAARSQSSVAGPRHANWSASRARFLLALLWSRRWRPSGGADHARRARAQPQSVAPSLTAALCPCAALACPSSVFNNVPSPVDLDGKGGFYLLFKEGLKPLMEDEGNRHGLKYRLEVAVQDMKVFAGWWEELVRARATP